MLVLKAEETKEELEGGKTKGPKEVIERCLWEKKIKKKEKSAREQHSIAIPFCIPCPQTRDTLRYAPCRMAWGDTSNLHKHYLT